jgi:hypothetical protein
MLWDLRCFDPITPNDDFRGASVAFHQWSSQRGVVRWQKDRPVDITSKLKGSNAVIRQKLALESASANMDNSGRPWRRPLNQRPGLPHELPGAARRQRAQSAEAGQCGISAEQSAGARYIGCDRIMGCEAALPHRAERARAPAYCLFAAACRLMNRAARQPALEAIDWHGASITNIWERCSSGYRKSRRGGLADSLGRQGADRPPFAQAFLPMTCVEPRRHEPESRMNGPLEPGEGQAGDDQVGKDSPWPLGPALEKHLEGLKGRRARVGVVRQAF